jgi:dienelactone hydrolase
VWVTPAWAHLTTEAVEYRDGDTVLEGHLVYDGHLEGKRPGILVVHEWRGLNDYAKRRASQLADLGYVAFAVDMYGKGVYAKDHAEAGQLSGAFRNDRQRMRTRILAALDVLKQQPSVDPAQISAIGYCFGGTTVLELARSGADVRGVVSFHGALDTPNPADARNIKGRVLVLHGAADQFVTPEQAAAFEQEMQQAGVSYQFIAYENAVHSFTVPEAGNDPSTGVAYNMEADKQSWEAMLKFFGELFGASQVAVGE